MSAPQYLRVREVAKRLDVGVDTVYRLIARGELEAVDVAVGSRRSNQRISEEALATFLATRKVA